MSQINARVRHKRDTSANWTSQNPVLLSGELIVVDTDSGEVRFKIGDGVKTYTQLPFQDEVVRGLISTSTSECKADAAAKLEEAKAYADGHLEEVEGGDTITWDGNTEGRLVYQSNCYKVSDATPYDIESGKLIESNGNVIEITSDDVAMSTLGMEVLAGTLTIYVVYHSDPEIAGIYFEKFNGFYVTSLTIDGYTGFPMKKLKTEYLPDHTHEVSLSQLGVNVTADTLNYMDGVTSKVQTQLDNKVDEVEGKGLSTNDYTTEEKNKLNALPDPETSQSGELVPFSEYTEDEIQALWDSVTV